jgi:hypothetical protein
MDIPGSTTKLISYRSAILAAGNAASFQNAFVYSAYLVNNLDQTTSIPQPPAGVRMLIPLATNRILGFVDTKSYYVFNGTSWGSTPVVFSTNGSATGTPSAALFEGVALDSNYFIIWSVSLSTSSDPGLGSSNTPAMYTRIGRFVDAGLGQVSTATASNDGLQNQGWYFPVWDQQPMVRDGTDAIYWFTRDATALARPAIKVQYQAGG